MLRQIILQIAGTTSAKTFPVILPDKCHVVSMTVVPGTTQTTASNVTAGADGVTHKMLEADLIGATTLVPVQAATPDDTTDAEAATIFGPDTPLLVIPHLSVASQLGICITIDPFLINDTI